MSRTKNNIIIPMILLGSMYAVLGFSIGVNAFFIPFVQQAFKVTTGMAYLIMTATFSAYLVFGGISGGILKKAGYKGGMVLSLIIMALGFFLIVPAAKNVSFPLLLLALFINGAGQSLLTGAANTYVSIIGPGESAASRIALMGICNKIFYALASLILAVFIDLSNARLEDSILPFYIISSILFVVGVFYYYAPLPEVKAVGEDENDQTININAAYSNTKTSIWQFPHLILGIVAIFCTVGVEHLALGTINDYATSLALSTPQNYVWFVSIGMILGYLIGALFIPKYISQGLALLFSTIIGVIVTILIIIFPSNVSIYFVPVLGLANAMLWPAVWPLAIADLGRFTKTGSSLLVTGIVGAAIIPLFFGYIAGSLSYKMAYIVCLPAYFFIAYYALWGSKIRTSKKNHDNEGL